jgi:hypothetical protein
LRPWTTVILTLAAATAAAGHAHAKCVLPVPSIVWSFPADGATDVPTNARVVVLTSMAGQTPAKIVVNGVPVSASSVPYSFEPVLEPNKEHVVTFAVGLSQPVQLGFRFTTGAGPAPAPAPGRPKVERQTTSTTRDLSPACAAALQVSGCFDTGENTHLVFETTSRPLYWLIERKPGGTGDWQAPTLWPGECGSPEDFIHDHQLRGFDPTRYRLTAVTLAGQTAATEVVGPGGGLGCAAGGRGPGGAAPLAALLVVAAASLRLARRRRR